MSTPLVSAEVTGSFRAHGFAVVPDLLTASELERFGAAVTQAVIERKRSDQRSLVQKSRYEQSFIQCQNLWEDHPEVRPLDFHARVGQAAAELLGVERIRLWHDQALYKEPGGRETDAHQDHPYWPIPGPGAGHGVAPVARDTTLTRDRPCSASTASRNRSSSAGHRCEYVSSVSEALAWPSADWTALIEQPAAISAEA